MVQYFRERNGLITPIDRTYEICSMHYDVLFAVCERYFRNIAYRYPEYCKDGSSYIVGISLKALTSDVLTEIPYIYINDFGIISSPCHDGNRTSCDYMSILDLIEFVFRNYRDVEFKYHPYYDHYHITPLSSRDTLGAFVSEINQVFEDKRLMYHASDEGCIERVVYGDVSVKQLSSSLDIIEDETLSDMLEDAIHYYYDPQKRSRSTSLIKIWGAFERLKTLEEGKKDESANKIISQMSSGNCKFEEVLQKEFKELTTIGNRFTIRHTETDSIPLNCDEHCDYLFQRCASLLVLGLRKHYVV